MTATLTRSPEELAKLSTPDLAKLYNSLNPPKPVARFADKETAIKRTLALMQANKGPKPTPPSSMPKKPDLPEKLGPAEGTAEDKPKPKVKRAPRAEGEAPRRKPFDLPAGKAIAEHREGTKRARVIELLTKGATFEEVMEDPAIKWDRRTAYEGIKLLHTHLGYGLKESADGKIKLIKS